MRCSGGAMGLVALLFLASLSFSAAAAVAAAELNNVRCATSLDDVTLPSAAVATASTSTSTPAAFTTISSSSSSCTRSAFTHRANNPCCHCLGLPLRRYASEASVAPPPPLSPLPFSVPRPRHHPLAPLSSPFRLGDSHTSAPPPSSSSLLLSVHAHRAAESDDNNDDNDESTYPCEEGRRRRNKRRNVRREWVGASNIGIGGGGGEGNESNGGNDNDDNMGNVCGGGINTNMALDRVEDCERTARLTTAARAEESLSLSLPSSLSSSSKASKASSFKASYAAATESKTMAMVSANAPTTDRRSFVASTSTTAAALASIAAPRPKVAAAATTTTTTTSSSPPPPTKAPSSSFFSSLFGQGRKKNKEDSGILLNSREGASSVQAVVGTAGDVALSAERCLLRLLPVKNPVFLALEAEIERVSVLKSKYGDDDDDDDNDNDNDDNNNNVNNNKDKDENSNNKNNKNKNKNDAIIPESAWKTASSASNNALRLLDMKRDRLQPVFNMDLDSTEMQIRRAQRGEEQIENLRNKIVDLINATTIVPGVSGAQYSSGVGVGATTTSTTTTTTTTAGNKVEGAEPSSSSYAQRSKTARIRNATAAFVAQRDALLALADVGELLVETFPYDVPDKGKYSYLPRLLGRAKVNFTLKRNAQVLGNVTVIADGFAAPITAGNFIDLCVRGFYTGLPIRTFVKRLGSPAALGEDEPGVAGVGSALVNLGSKVGIKFEQDEGGSSLLDGAGSSGGATMTTTLPIWGSFNEGFYDPLTAKPRRIPLEIVELDRTRPGGGAKLIYAGGFATSGSFSMGGNALIASLAKRTPVITFDIPGVVGMNHPDRYPNGGSSEFFILPESQISPEKTKLLDKLYAPFGYVVDGYDLLETLKPGDVISATEVGEWGRVNLVKVRNTSFGEIIQGSGNDEDEESEPLEKK